MANMKLRKVKAGDPVRASDHNNVVDALNRVANLRGGPGISVINGPGGVVLSNSRGPTFPAKIISNVGGNLYTVQPVDKDGTVYAGKSAMQAYETNNDAGVANGTNVTVFRINASELGFFRPVKSSEWDGCCLINQAAAAVASPTTRAATNTETAAPLAAERRLMVHLASPVGTATAVRPKWASLGFGIVTSFTLNAAPGGGWDFVDSGGWTMGGITQDFDHDGTRPGVGRDTWNTQPTIGALWGNLTYGPQIQPASSLNLAVAYQTRSASTQHRAYWQGEVDLTGQVGPFYGMMLSWEPPQTIGVGFAAFTTTTTVAFPYQGGIIGI